MFGACCCFTFSPMAGDLYAVGTSTWGMGRLYPRPYMLVSFVPWNRVSSVPSSGVSGVFRHCTGLGSFQLQ